MKTYCVYATLIAIMLGVEAAELRGGFARVDITPAKPVKMAGYASRVDLSRDVHDPLSARGMALEADGKRLLIISTDILGWYNNTAEPIRKAIVDETKLEPSELFLCAIHTHAGPAVGFDEATTHANNVEYTRELQGKLTKLAKEALANLGPVRVGVGSGSSPVGVNRREPVPDTNGATRIVLGRNPHRPIDRETQVLKFTREDGTLAAVSFAYAVHSTSLGTRNFLISGDIHGLAAQFVEKYFGGNVVTPEFAGASGNIDPWYRVLPGFNTMNNWIPEPILMSTMLGQEVVMVANQMRDRDAITNAAIKSAIKTVNLPRKPRQQIEAAATEADTPIVVTIAAVGNIAFVGLGGEVFTEIGMAIKKASPFAHTVIMTHCNGAAGYLPTRESYSEGGYEVQSSPFAEGADERLIRKVVAMLGGLR